MQRAHLCSGNFDAWGGEQLWGPGDAALQHGASAAHLQLP